MDARTGELIYAKRPDERLPPASTTKVMTALLALESGRLEETALVSRAAAAVQPIKLYLKPGERVRLSDLTHAILLRSANDASVVIAEALGGSVGGFATKMNRQAVALGARNTRFVNPNGLPAGGHYSTARDLALILQHAMRLPRFPEVAGASQARISVRSRRRSRTIYLRNNNRLLQDYRVPVIGKTGYTRAAKRCFVGAGRADGREVVVALLGSTDLWGDARRLLDFGFTHASVGIDQPGKVNHSGARTGHPVAAGSAPLRKTPQVAAVRADGFEGREERREYSLVITPTHNSLEAAERLRHFVDRRGHRAVIETFGPPDSVRYFVRVLGLPTRDAALRAGAQLRAEHLQPTIVPPG